MASPTFVRDSSDHWDDGWSRTPNGLWTLDVTNGAKVLLGWLHSHTDAFLAKVTLGHARRAVGSSSIADWFESLEAAGFVTIIRNNSGKPWRFTLHMAPWKALIGHRDRAEIGSVTAPKSDDIEDQPEDHSSSLRSEVELNDQTRDNAREPTLDERANSVAREYWDWYVLENPGLKPTINFLGLRAVAKNLLKAGHEPDSIVDAMKTARAWTAKALAAEITRKRAEAEQRTTSVAIPHGVVKAFALAEPWLTRHGISGPSGMPIVARAMKLGGLEVGEAMLRLAVVFRDFHRGETDGVNWYVNPALAFAQKIAFCESVPRSSEQPADYPDAMERAFQNRRWVWS